MISLQEFIAKTKGTHVNVKGLAKNQCVTLVQAYIKDCLGQPAKARGNANQWDENYVSEGLGHIVNDARYGDIVVFNKGTYGHIAIYINESTIYDQSSIKKAGYSKMQKNPVFIRPNAELIPDKKFGPGKYKLLEAKCIRRNHTIANNIIKVKEVGFDDIKNQLVSQKKNDNAKLKVGSIVNVTLIYIDSTGRVWGRLRNTWIVLCNKDGTLQAKQI